MPGKAAGRYGQTACYTDPLATGKPPLCRADDSTPQSGYGILAGNDGLSECLTIVEKTGDIDAIEGMHYKSRAKTATTKYRRKPPREHLILLTRAREARQ